MGESPMTIGALSASASPTPTAINRAGKIPHSPPVLVAQLLLKGVTFKKKLFEATTGPCIQVALQTGYFLFVGRIDRWFLEKKLRHDY